MFVIKGARVVCCILPLHPLEVPRTLVNIIGQVLRGSMKFISRHETSVIPPIQIEAKVRLQSQSIEHFCLEEEITDHLVRLAVTVDQPQSAYWIDVLFLHPR